MNQAHIARRATSSGAYAYGAVGMETAVMSASPYQLITLLFDGAKTAIGMARHHMGCGDMAAKGRAISKVIDIVDNGLKASLDANAAGEGAAELVANLGALYDYINRRLLYANLHNDLAALDEAGRLLEDIGSAWREIELNGLARKADAGKSA